MSKALVYVDFDDVLCQTADAFLGVVEREFGRRYAFDDIHFFDLEKSFHLNQEEYEHLMGLIHDPSILRIMVPMPGVLDVLKEWAAVGVQTVVVTGRPPETEPVCHEWLERHNIQYDRVLFVDKYGRTPSSQVGVEVVVPENLIDLGFTLAVEDAPAMIEFLVHQTDIPVAVLERPWNRRMDLSRAEGRVVRCKDWLAVGEVLNERVRCSA
ncbi:MAG: hypothetical protein QGH42_02390 [Kiritimatiellia bacterium]|jgi:hypothetical protein|nr:hypothetical protein [Kiritimatiellia bacterium]MDP6811060.1 hypothetical protein [Kiritimatiellia bacterium]MDP7023085.1 hypothetical protein [Kiritimatiellia bacterium]